MLVHSFIVKQTSYHKNIQASEQHNDANILIFRYHAFCTALSAIQKYMYAVSKYAVIVEEIDRKVKLAVIFGGLRETT
jgi:hypothetical protein